MTARIRSKALRARVMGSDEAVERFVPDRGSIAFSCMGGASLAKEIPEALARSADAGRRYELTLLTGGATTNRFERNIARLGLRRRFPYLSEMARKGVNEGSVEFFDCRIGEYPDLVRQGRLTDGKPVDVAVVEATSIDEEGRLIPTLSRRIAEAVAAFLEGELTSEAWGGRFALQLGAGPLAAAVMDVLPFRGADVWTEGIPARWVEVLGERVRGISTTSMYALPGDGRLLDEFAGRLDVVLEHVVLRPYEVTNSLEVIARMNVAAVQQAIEVDLFGGANTSHIGRDAYNGVGGSPDFTRAARLVVVAMASTAAGGRYSRIVPLLSSSDIPRQDVDVLVTEQGHEDLRGLSPRERAEKIIDRCSHPSFREGLSAYYRTVKEAGGHLPFSLEAAARFLGAQGRD